MLRGKSSNCLIASLLVSLATALPACLYGYQEKLDKAREYMYRDYEKAIRMSEEILSENPEATRALWIKSIAYTNLGDMQDDAQKQESYYEKADKLADRALEAEPDDPNSYHAKAIVLGRMAQKAGAREGLRLSREVKKYSDRVLELDEEHGGAWFVRGMLMYRIDTLSRLERWIANSLFGGLPFEADRDAALSAIGRAVELNPDNIYFRLEFGRILKEYGRKNRARRILESTLELEPVTPQDEAHLDEVRELLDNL